MISKNVICIFAVSAEILTKYTKDIMRKKGKNMVKKDLTKLVDI
jgi:hypothetical protein